MSYTFVKYKYDTSKPIYRKFNDTGAVVHTKYCSNDVITTADVFNTLNEKQKTVVYATIGQTLETMQTVIPKIKDVIYNDPATIVFWEDGTKTVVKCKNEKFDPEKGLAMAFSKKMLGNKGNYYNIFKKWLPEEK